MGAVFVTMFMLWSFKCSRILFTIPRKAKKPREIINLGSGNGTSVFEAIAMLESITNLKLKHNIERREGDVIEIYSNSDKARALLG